MIVLCIVHQPRHERMSMWLDIYFTRRVAMSKGSGNVSYIVLSSAHAKGVTALGRK